MQKIDEPEVAYVIQYLHPETGRWETMSETFHDLRDAKDKAWFEYKYGVGLNFAEDVRVVKRTTVVITTEEIVWG